MLNVLTLQVLWFKYYMVWLIFLLQIKFFSIVFRPFSWHFEGWETISFVIGHFLKISTITYPQILTIHFTYGKRSIFQFKKKSVVWNSLNKIFTFKKFSKSYLLFEGHNKIIKKMLLATFSYSLKNVSLHCFYIAFIILINNSRRKDKGNQWHDGGCISDTKFCWFT